MWENRYTRLFLGRETQAERANLQITRIEFEETTFGKYRKAWIYLTGPMPYAQQVLAYTKTLYILYGPCQDPDSPTEGKLIFEAIDCKPQLTDIHDLIITSNNQAAMITADFAVECWSIVFEN